MTTTGKKRTEPRDPGRILVPKIPLAGILEYVGDAARAIRGAKTRYLAGHADAEVAIMIPMIMCTPELRAEHRVRHDATFLWTPSGRARQSHFPDVPGEFLNGDMLERYYGVLGVDQWGGRLDQHMLAENRSRSVVASIDIIARSRAVTYENCWLAPIARVIADLDVSATALAHDATYQESEYPHTQRTYSTLIKGWRYLVEALPGEWTPERMIRNWFVSFLAASELVMEALESVPQDHLDRAVAEFDAKRQGIFMVENLVHGAYRYFERYLDRETAKQRAYAYELDCASALGVWEDLWDETQEEVRDPRRFRAMRPFPARLRLFERTVDPETGREYQTEAPQPQRRTVRLVTLRSESPRAAVIARKAAKLKKSERPEGFPFMQEPLVHVIRKGGGWTIGSKRTNLTEVAAALRASEVVLEGGELLPEYDVRQTGPFLFRDANGRVVEGPYFPIFRSVVGVEFDTNPGALPRGRLTPEERNRVAKAALQNRPPTPNDEFACRDPEEPYCHPRCPLYRFEFEGCRRFRERLEAAAMEPAESVSESDVLETVEDVRNDE